MNRVAALAVITYIFGSAAAQPVLEENYRLRNDRLCTTVDCLRVAYEVKRSLNFSVDPCDNFYKFTCDGFEKDTRIPDDKTSVSEFTPMIDDLYQEGRDLLEEEHKEGDWELYKMVRQYYKDCSSIEERNKLGNAPAKAMLESLGGWPVLGASNEKPYYQLQADLVAKGFSGNSDILASYVTSDSKANDKRVIIIDQPSLGISREHFFKNEGKNKHVDAYLQLMIDTAVYFGADPETAEAEMKKVFDFEFELAKASAPKEERRDAEALYNPFTIDNLETLDGHPPNWKDYLQNIIQVDLEDTEKVVIYNPKYLHDYADIVAKTDNVVLVNYLMFNAASSTLSLLDEDAREIKHKFDKATSGIKKQQPIWRSCAYNSGFNTGGTGLSIISASMYLNRHFKLEAKRQMDKMAENVREALRRKIEEVTWMDDETRDVAREKLKNMRQTVGYPEEILDEEKVSLIFEGLEITPKNYFASSFALNRFFKQYYFNRLRKPIDKNYWLDNDVSLSVLVVNAFYSPPSNMFVFPAARLRGIFFNSEAPRYMNYGGIGAVIGHEISHGFDDQGRQRDAEGILRNWWSNETLAQFKERAQCVIDQYGGFVSSQVNETLNGVATQGENIADIMGYHLAYQGYELFMEENGVEPQLPGLPFTPRQMYWIARGRSYCRKSTDDALINRILTGVHSPMEFRTNGALMNYEDFARDFNCPVGSFMNPETKCRMW